MARHVTIGTAGHVDHGKTALVKALTGTDTDRWAEEKRRGITIDLGFAALDLGGGMRASIVDVPGHEDFVRNMVAGASGVDIALLVVAADEGIMPQTTEHVAILELLGLQAGVIAITKSDLVDADWLELVSEEVSERLAESSVAWERPITVSVESGVGLTELQAALARGCGQAVARDTADLFRLPVDRVFSLPGAGSVVTGTVTTGSVQVGEDIRVLPAGARARIRSIQVHGEAARQALPSRRTALALSGLERGAAVRGSVVVSDPAWQATETLDVLLTLLPGARPLTQRSRVRLLLGTAEIMARVTPAGPRLNSGTPAVARLRLEAPIVARWGDRAVIRQYSPVATIGGAVVIDPWPPLRPRRPPVHLDLAVDDASQRVVTLADLTSPEGLEISSLAVRTGLRPRDVEPTISAVLAREGGPARLGKSLVSGQAVADARRTVLDRLAAYHNERPLEPGMPRELLRQLAPSPEVAEHVHTALADEDWIVIEGDTVRLSAHAPALSPGQRQAGALLQRLLADAGGEGRTVAELARHVRQDARELADYYVRSGTAIRVGNRYYDRGVLEAVAVAALRTIQGAGDATPAQLRGALGLTRKYLIPVLEWMDGQGMTVRVGNARRLGPNAQRVLEGA